jgi:hypothetical protein
LGFEIQSIVIACDKRKAFAQGSEATKQSIGRQSKDGLLRGVYHRARFRATRWLAITAFGCAYTNFIKSDTAWR